MELIESLRAMRDRRVASGFAVAVLAVLGVFVAVLPAAASDPPDITRQELAGMTFFNSCTGEEFTITDGTFQLIVHATVDASGGFHVTARGNAQGVTARGAVTGDLYRLAGDFWAEENVDDDGFPSVVQLVEVHNVISQGSSENVIVQVVSHVTINPDGVVTASVDSFRAECRG